MPDAYDEYSRRLDEIRKLTPKGSEYWRGRDLQPLLGYDKWENFELVIRKAAMACESAGVGRDNHFLETRKMVPVGSGAERPVSDYFLSRYASYLMAMNADPQKPEVGFAQTYFAVQTRRQEMQDQLEATEKRFELRERVRGANKGLAGAARRAGVQRFGIFQDEGYKGLYGGLGRDEIKTLKSIDAKEDLLDCIGRTELAANEFRITQAQEKLNRENVSGEQAAFRVHHEVGKEVRQTIKKIGGTMPEHLPAETSLKQLASGRKRGEIKGAAKEITDGTTPAS